MKTQGKHANSSPVFADIRFLNVNISWFPFAFCDNKLNVFGVWKLMENFIFAFMNH